MPEAVFLALLGAAATSSGVLGGLGATVIPSSSTSNTSIPAGRPPAGCIAVGERGRDPEARFSPTIMSCSPSVHPLMTPPTGKRAGWPRLTELSNIRPSVVQPV